MKKVSTEKQRELLLSVLSEIDGICRGQGIEYSLAYGTLLGAVRHKGFIPWDDDVDIMMPRSEYLRFVDYCRNNKTGFKLAAAETDPEYGYIFAKACDTTTKLIYENTKWNKHGLQVDIFPVENLGSTREEAERMFAKRKLQRELLVAWNWKKYVKNPSRSTLRNLARLVFYILSRFTSNRALIKSIKKYYESAIGKECRYAGIVCGAYREREIMEKDIFDGCADIGFEDKTFRAIKNYDRYLTAIYGDYMTPPPEDERVPCHDFRVYEA